MDSLPLSSVHTCDVTQFTTAATNQNAVGCAAHTEADSDYSFDITKTSTPSNMPALIGRSHGKLSRFTATQFQ